ncbi:MAG: pullulanase-type alpha-1,6-glucosidase [Betaproteobacteria bacterium]
MLFPVETQASTLEARAVWLNSELIKWPGANMPAQFRLYFSGRGSIHLSRKAEIRGADGSIPLLPFTGALPEVAINRFKHLRNGVILTVPHVGVQRLKELHRGQLVLMAEDNAGKAMSATAIQSAGALDDLYAPATEADNLGVTVNSKNTRFQLWAPTAQQVSLCTYASGAGLAKKVSPMHLDPATGIWSLHLPGDSSGTYYTYLLDVFTAEKGLVRNRVTDPYSISLAADSTRSHVLALGQSETKPPGWDQHRPPHRIKGQTDIVIYELHVRDFSADDESVAAAYRGKYLAFTEAGSSGMKHLRSLASAGLTDIHLLPVFDFATVPELHCVSPDMSGIDQSLASPEPQRVVSATRDKDCFNWGYDPLHYSAPEGSYAINPEDAAGRVIEFRRMVMALHREGLRVGMDVVYNHTSASGQKEKSVLDRIVPGYYHRLDGNGAIEHSTCCENTATENAMMAKLMIDSVVTWARDYKIDSFRFDLMGHQPRHVMERLKRRVKSIVGRDIALIGEGWNFGEVANGARFEQASQLSLRGSGIGTFNDRLRDAVRGGSAGDRGEELIRRQGYVNGLVYDRNAMSVAVQSVELQKTADMVRAGLAGSIGAYRTTDAHGKIVALRDIDYGGQPAGYAAEPAEVVNYVENHDNHTLFDINVFKLPVSTSREDRARVQVLALAINAFSQGVAYFHAGVDLLRSKSLDRNSFDSGDWFNRIDWTATDNYFATGLPPERDNGAEYALLKPLLANRDIKPTAKEIAWTRDAFLDLLKIRASSTLFRLRSADEIRKRLTFYNTGPDQLATVLVGHLDGKGYPGAAYREIIYLVNVDIVAHRIGVPIARGNPFELHPVLAGAATDGRAAAARFDRREGAFEIPPRTAVVFVMK